VAMKPEHLSSAARYLSAARTELFYAAAEESKDRELLHALVEHLDALKQQIEALGGMEAPRLLEWEPTTGPRLPGPEEDTGPHGMTDLEDAVVRGTKGRGP